MLHDFEQLYANRRAVIVELLKENVVALRSWDIPYPHSLPFDLLADKLEIILANEFGVETK